jgi:hypothetical protein
VRSATEHLSVLVTKYIVTIINMGTAATCPLRTVQNLWKVGNPVMTMNFTAQKGETLSGGMKRILDTSPVLYTTIKTTLLEDCSTPYHN